MSYTKTTWNDLTAPAIDATNLNKIEQGIYDNSIDITSINTLIGSSGTATTTQTDYTEGQLTQKLGLKYIKMKGQTSQYSTTGKNILENTLTQSTNEGITFTSNSDGSVTVNGTATGTALAWVNSNFTLPAGTYTLSGCPSGGSNNTYRLDINSGAYIDTGNGVTFTLSSETTITNVRMRIENGYTVNKIVFKPMIEKASAKTTYEPYTGGIASPNPSYPQEVNNVSGSNILKVCNKNLFSSKMEIGGINNNTGEINGETNCIRTADFIEVSPNTKYTLQNDKNYNLLIYEYDSSKAFIQYTGNYVNPKTWTTQANTKYIKVRSATAAVETDLTAKYQLETGNTATTYIAHREEDYYIDLGSINLIDISNTTKYPSATTSGVTVTNNGDGSLTLDGTATAKVNYFITSNPKTYFESEFGAYTYKCFGLPATCNSNISYGGQPTGENIQTYNINTAGRNYSIRIEIPSGVTVTNVRIKPMLVKGTYTATTYPNYEANVYNIELCKIGNYQDYIYKNNGKWYKYEAIGKVNLAEKSITLQSTNSYGIANFLCRIVESNYMTSTNINATLCNRFSIQDTGISTTETEGYLPTLAGSTHEYNVYIRIESTKASTVTEFQQWLTNNPTYYYWTRYTPVIEEITYEPLLRQLDKLDKIGLYDISNISQDNSDMKMLLDFTICNDNYNGLREFIRS